MQTSTFDPNLWNPAKAPRLYQPAINPSGQRGAFDPVTNMRVGVKVLQECIARAGSLEGGLRYYVGAANLADDGGYAGKVLAEHERLRQVAAGRTPAATPPTLRANPVQVVAPPAPKRTEPDPQVALLGES